MSGPGGHSADTVWTLCRRSFHTSLGARNYFWNEVLKSDGSNITLGKDATTPGSAPPLSAAGRLL
eukprot:929456-Pyramimonas_sp.AAC.1